MLLYISCGFVSILDFSELDTPSSYVFLQLAKFQDSDVAG